MTSYSLTGLVGMGTVTNESSTKDSGLFQTPMPYADSDDAIMLDMFGASRTITVSGVFATGDGSYSTNALAIAALDALINGQQTSKTFVSGKSGSSYTVLVQSVEWKSDEGDVNKVTYTIVLTEGST